MKIYFYLFLSSWSVLILIMEAVKIQFKKSYRESLKTVNSFIVHKNFKNSYNSYKHSTAMEINDYTYMCQHA